jgi:hypothetical protein
MRDDLRDAARRLRERLGWPHRRAPLSVPDDHGRLLAAIPRGDGELRVVWDESRGLPLVTFRVWLRRADGWLPQVRGGFSCRLNELADLAEAVVAALDAAQRWTEEERGR